MMGRGPPGGPMGDFGRMGPGAADRSLRSVFVGNISYEVTEEQLRNVFSQVGPVVHLRMMHDRETGKPKGYGFCEFADVTHAEAAIRNLNGHELHGRPLRVDSAAGSSERGPIEEPLPPAQPVEQENPYGPEPEPGKAPEAISRTVASLPPEKMFELMKQMRDVIRGNPEEGRAMLLENPQLAYALLQAQVVMRIVDPQVAIAMLHRETPTGPHPPVTTPFHHVAPPYGNMGGMPPPMGPPLNMPPPGIPVGPGPQFGGPPRAGGPPPMNLAPSDDQGDAELLMQVLKLSDEEIAMLPPGDREKVIELRNQLKSLPT